MSRYMAEKAASKRAESLMAPLLDAIDDDESTESESTLGSTKVESVKLTPLQKLKSFVVLGVLSAGVAASVGAMIIAPAIIVFVMGGVCIGSVPYSAIKEIQLRKLPSLRTMNNKLREDANRLEEEVEVLSEEIDLLKPEADRAAEVEGELRLITKEQDINVNKLVELVKENETILVKMRDNLRQRIVQDIITIVVKSDKDNDQSIDRIEAKTLALRIRLALQEYGVEFDAEKFLTAIRRDPSVTGVMGIARRLLEHNSDKVDGSGLSEDDDDMYDMFFLSNDDDATSKQSLFGSGHSGHSGHSETLARGVSDLTIDEEDLISQRTLTFQEPSKRRMSLKIGDRRSSIRACEMDQIVRISQKCASTKKVGGSGGGF